jgi:hypothetical protein
MALPVTITGISTAVAPVGPFKSTNGNYYFFGLDGTTATTLQAYKAGAGATIYSIATTLAQSVVFANNTGTGNRICQTFTTGASDQAITSITFALSKASLPTDNLVVDLQLFDTGTSKPTGAVLGTTGAIAGSALTTSAARYTFTFATPVAISPNTRYAAILRRVGAGSASAYFLIHQSSGAGQNADAAQGSNGYTVGTSTWQTYSIIDYDLIVTGTTTGDPSVSWGSIATKTGFTTAILNIAAYQVGNVIHLAVQDGTMSSSVATKYLSFDAATDTFLATTETVAAASVVTGQATAGWGASLVVRSNGNAVILYNGLQVNTSGTARARMYYRERTGLNTYGTATRVDANTATDNTTPFAVLGAAGRVHFAFTAAATTGLRTLSAANALNTFASNASMTAPGDGVSYDRSGTIKVVFTSNVNGSQGTLRFDSSDNPAATFANQSIAAATIPHRIGTFPNTDDVTIVYRSSADSDLYSIKSSDDGATFGAPVAFFVGTVANADTSVSRSSSGSVYTRGSNSVVGYIVNDGGTLKYNENSLATNKTLDATVGATYAVTGASTTTVLLKRKLDATTGSSYTLTGTDVAIAKGAPPKRLTADPGSYLLTGASTTTILRRARIDAAAASYAVTGASTSNVLHKAKIDATVGGAYALTGTAVSLLHKYRPVALGGSYLLTGTDAALTKLAQKTLAAGTASYALTGTDAAVIKRVFKRLTADGSSYAVTGAAPSAVLVKRKLTADAGTYALTGTAATPWHGYKVIAGASSYALTGNATAVLLHRWKVAATGETYALTGNSATFLIHKDIVSAAPGAYALTGAAVNFQIRTDKFLSAALGTYTITGTPVSVRVTWKLAATAGSYAVTGTDAALTRRVPKTLVAGSASYALTGTAASVLHRWKTAALGSSYALTGSPATVVHRFKIAAASASYALTGTAANVTKVAARTVTAAPGAYALTGATASALHRVKLPAVAGSYSLTGSPATVRYGYKVPAGSSSYALTGAAVTFPRTRRLIATGGTYALTGKPALVLYNWRFPAVGSSYTITGTPATLRRAKTIQAAATTYALTGSVAYVTQVRLLFLEAETTSYRLTGNVARLFTGEWGISNRTVLAVAEDRSIAVAAELRTVKAVAETRLVRVPAELRMVAAPEEFRTIQARGENHGVSTMGTKGRGRTPRLQHRLVTPAD